MTSIFKVMKVVKLTPKEGQQSFIRLAHPRGALCSKDLLGGPVIQPDIKKEMFKNKGRKCVKLSIFIKVKDNVALQRA